MLFLELSEAASEVEMRVIVHLLVFEQQKRVAVNRQFYLLKILIA